MTITDLPPTIPDHPAHEGHVMRLLVPDQVMPEETCNGCKAPIKSGRYFRYICEDQHCNIKVLHACCAVKPDTIKPDHELYSDVQFEFLLVHKTGVRGKTCGICGGEMKPGFVYHGGADVYLHPCCALQSGKPGERPSKRMCKCNNPNATNRGLTIGKQWTRRN